MGTSEPNSTTFLAGKLAGMSGVQTGPGATPLTRIPFSTSASESDRVKATMAPLVAE